MQWQHLPNNKTRNVSKLTNVGLALHRIMLNIETAGRLEITCDMESTGVSIRSIALAKKNSILLWGEKKKCLCPKYLEHIRNKTSTDHISILVSNGLELTYRWCARTWLSNTGLTLPTSYDSGRKSKYIFKDRQDHSRCTNVYASHSLDFISFTNKWLFTPSISF